MTASPHAPARPIGWWRRNRGWLAAAAVFGVLAFALPWVVMQRELDRIRPRTPVAATAAWNAYEGARWRLVGVRTQPAPAGSATDYQHPDATLVIVDYEVIPGPGVDVRRLDQCTGRLVDAAGRAWEANTPAKVSSWMFGQGLGGRCGSRIAGGGANAAAGEAYGFTHVFLVPAGLDVAALQADIVFPPSTTRPRMGTFLRFDLAAAPR